MPASLTDGRASRRIRVPRVAVIPGDGIGIETTAAALTVLRAAQVRWNLELELETFPWSCAYYAQTGMMMAADGLEQLAAFDAVLLGAVGDPSVPDDIAIWDLVLAIRRRFEQYVNVRPVRWFEGLPSPLRAELMQGVDFVIIRENGEGEYSRVGGVVMAGQREDTAVQVSTFTRAGTERAANYAFEMAQRRRSKVTSATKSNALTFSMPFWDRIVGEVGQRFPEVELRSMHVDALAAKLVLSPAAFDVIVASNLFGDILSDLGAALMGSVGMGPSANIDPSGRHPPMFEPVHGSAPDISGKGIANPIGQIWSLSMMLDHLGSGNAASAILTAVGDVIRAGRDLTPDLGGTGTCDSVTRQIVASIASAGDQKRDRVPPDRF
jgi:tartrate dehydrogenase/decarboxylase / D-malate dehydrogenase